jgi:hypothetical protein
VKRVWHRHRSVTLWQHEDPSSAQMPPFNRTRWQRYRFSTVPDVWWRVMGRRWYGRVATRKIRDAWGLGSYPINRGSP